MSFFNWFSSKSGRASAGSSDSSGLRDNRGRSLPARDTAPSLPQRAEDDPVHGVETRKARRHARREQLYVAVREAMTRSGVLASSYKFKVLSLDQRGDEFLAMIDVSGPLGRQPEKLEQIETAIIQLAKARFELIVTSVYWRTDARTAGSMARPTAHFTASANPAPESKKAVGPRYDPIHEDEVAAFKSALALAADSHPITTDASGKSRSGLHSYTLLTGFEDTEMPESTAAPALSTTQYGDLT
jgi:hypothetical protein